jgi:hypothetical protein
MCSSSSPSVAVEQVAHEREAGLLALDLAGVDAVEHQHHRQPGARASAGVRTPRVETTTSGSSRPPGL